MFYKSKKYRLGLNVVIILFSIIMLEMLVNDITCIKECTRLEMENIEVHLRIGSTVHVHCIILSFRHW